MHRPKVTRDPRHDVNDDHNHERFWSDFYHERCVCESNNTVFTQPDTRPIVLPRAVLSSNTFFLREQEPQPAVWPRNKQVRF